MRSITFALMLLCAATMAAEVDSGVLDVAPNEQPLPEKPVSLPQNFTIPTINVNPHAVEREVFTAQYMHGNNDDGPFPVGIEVYESEPIDVTDFSRLALRFKLESDPVGVWCIFVERATGSEDEPIITTEAALRRTLLFFNANDVGDYSERVSDEVAASNIGAQGWSDTAQYVPITDTVWVSCLAGATDGAFTLNFEQIVVVKRR